jgi:ATP-dependent Zn protease
MLMAGRIAEKLFIGDFCTGASQDIKVATDLATRMVTDFGMSDKIGAYYCGQEDEMALRMYNSTQRSEKLQSEIDAEIKLLIANAEKSATEILTKHKIQADVMTEVLIARETIYTEDIDLIMKGKNAKDVMVEIDKRDVASKEQEKQDKIKQELENLNRDLEHIMKHSKRFVDAKLANEERLIELEKNFEIARDAVKNGKPLPQLPTLDNLAEYGKLLEVKTLDAENPSPAGKEKKIKETADETSKISE